MRVLSCMCGLVHCVYQVFSAVLAYVGVCVFLVINLKQMLIADVVEKEFCTKFHRPLPQQHRQ
jgi:hypothetical protein